MTTKTRQIVTLVGLLVVLGGVITYQLSPSDTAGAGVAPSNSREARPRTPERLQVAEVALDRLTPGADSFQAPRRDPFSFRPKPIQPPPPQGRNAQPPPVFVAPQQPPAAPPVRPITRYYLG